MQNIRHYLQDGANYQARAVLAHLQGQISDGIESSWNKEYKEYDAKIYVGRWENCREQGYVCTLRNKKHDQINIAWFEHRNSDQICAIKWGQNTINSPNIDTADFKDVYKDKFDVSFSVGYREYAKMGTWVFETLVTFWNTN